MTSPTPKSPFTRMVDIALGLLFMGGVLFGCYEVLHKHASHWPPVSEDTAH